MHSTLITAEDLYTKASSKTAPTDRWFLIAASISAAQTRVWPNTTRPTFPGAVYAHLDRHLSDKTHPLGARAGRHPLPEREAVRQLARSNRAWPSTSKWWCTTGKGLTTVAACGGCSSGVATKRWRCWTADLAPGRPPAIPWHRGQPPPPAAPADRPFTPRRLAGAHGRQPAAWSALLGSPIADGDRCPRRAPLPRRSGAPGPRRGPHPRRTQPPFRRQLPARRPLQAGGTIAPGVRAPAGQAETLPMWFTTAAAV